MCLYDYEDLEDLKEAKEKKGLTYEQLGEMVGHDPLFVASALNGQQHVPPEDAKKFAEALGVSEEDVEVLTQHPYKGETDPVLYRFQEMVDVYGPSIKELIHEQFGNGIMSAIDYSINVSKKEDPSGDRVVITMEGKFLPYKLF